ncbi:MAG: DMT family transporter [Candidatus Cloacimonadales bacterium]|nr:DMT family transporter [Candidatus Cloacimonadales bacterium]
MKFRYLFLAFITVIFWGISLPVTTVLLQNGFTPNLITFLRFLIATFLLYLVIRKRKMRSIAKEDRAHFYLLGLAGTTLFFFFENTALKFTTVSNTALITATIPLFTLIVAAIFYQKKILWQNLIGIPLGLAGTVLLFYKDLQASSLHLKGDLLVVGSVTMWILYSFTYRKVEGKYDSLTIIYRTFIYGCLFSLPLLIFEFNRFRSININFSVLISLLFLAVFCTFLGYYFWTLAFKNIGVKVTSNLILLIPVVSIAAGVLFLKEIFTIPMLLASGFIICSVYLTSISHRGGYF